ncbi:MAG: leucine-rich repeat domain-containing protein [Clostridia bacterium]|nr:leucine-rich repeat domain-containing protein [Clostridia bacterium]
MLKRKLLVLFSLCFCVSASAAVMTGCNKDGLKSEIEEILEEQGWSLGEVRSELAKQGFNISADEILTRLKKSGKVEAHEVDEWKDGHRKGHGPNKGNNGNGNGNQKPNEEKGLWIEGVYINSDGDIILILGDGTRINLGNIDFFDPPAEESSSAEESWGEISSETEHSSVIEWGSSEEWNSSENWWTSSEEEWSEESSVIMPEFSEEESSEEESSEEESSSEEEENPEDFDPAIPEEAVRISEYMMDSDRLLTQWSGVEINTDLNGVAVPNGFSSVTRFDSKTEGDYAWTSSALLYNNFNRTDLSNYSEVWFATKMVNGRLYITPDASYQKDSWIYFHLTQTGETLWTIEVTVDGEVLAKVENQNGEELSTHQSINSLARILWDNAWSSEDGSSVLFYHNNEGKQVSLYCTEVLGLHVCSFEKYVSLGNGYLQLGCVCGATSGDLIPFDYVIPEDAVYVRDSIWRDDKYALSVTTNEPAPVGFINVVEFDWMYNHMGYATTHRDFPVFILSDQDLSGYSDIYFAIKIENGKGFYVRLKGFIECSDWMYVHYQQAEDGTWSLSLQSPDGYAAENVQTGLTGNDIKTWMQYSQTNGVNGSGFYPQRMDETQESIVYMTEVLGVVKEEVVDPEDPEDSSSDEVSSEEISSSEEVSSEEISSEESSSEEPEIPEDFDPAIPEEAVKVRDSIWRDNKYALSATTNASAPAGFTNVVEYKWNHNTANNGSPWGASMKDMSLICLDEAVVSDYGDVYFAMRNYGGTGFYVQYGTRYTGDNWLYYHYHREADGTWSLSLRSPDGYEAINVHTGLTGETLKDLMSWTYSDRTTGRGCYPTKTDGDTTSDVRIYMTDMRAIKKKQMIVVDDLVTSYTNESGAVCVDFEHELIAAGRWKLTLEGQEQALFVDVLTDSRKIVLANINTEKLSGKLGVITIQNNEVVIQFTNVVVICDGLVFELLADDTYAVTDYTGTATEVVIPSIYQGKPVTSIGGSAFSNCRSLTKVVIPDSVTAINLYAFYGCFNLTEIIIPNSVTSIGSSAFESCDSLTEIIIPDGVTKISGYAFYDCRNLTKIVIPNSVTAIEDAAFYWCGRLTDIVIPDSVTLIGDEAFYECQGLTEIIIPGSVKTIGYGAFYRCSRLKEVVISDGVTSVGMDVFYGCSSLTKIVIPDSVTAINLYTFSGCSSLTEVIIPDSVTSIGDWAFESCSSLTIYCEAESKPAGWSTDWNISNRPVYWYSESEPAIEGNYWHYGESGEIIIWEYVQEPYTDGLVFELLADDTYSVTDYTGTATEVVIPARYQGKPVTSIGVSAFYDCRSLTEVIIPNSVTTIGQGAFYGCSSLTEIIIPDSVTSIGSSAFCGCDSLTEIIIPDGVTKISAYAFYDCSSLTKIVIPNSVTAIEVAAFFWCARLTDIVIPDSVTLIGDEAFYECQGLTEIIIPGSVKTIGYGAFSGCSRLKEVVISDGVTSIDDSAFESCSSLTKIVIPDSVTEIIFEAFYGCRSLTEIIIPDSVTSMGSCVVSNCDNLTIYCEAESKPAGWVGDWNISNRPVYWYSASEPATEGNYWHYGESGEIIVWHKHAWVESEKSVDVTCLENGKTVYECACGEEYEEEIYALGHNYVDGICDRCGEEKPSEGLKYTLNSDGESYSVTGLGTCTDTKVVIPAAYEGKAVTKIGDSAFSERTVLEKIVIPDSITTIASSAFINCSSLTEITVKENNKAYQSIDGNLYSKDKKTLKQYAIGKIDSSFMIPNGVTTIGSDAFYYCRNLTEVEIPDSVTIIGSNAFENCINLTNVNIGNKVETIGKDAFRCCNLMEIVIPESVTMIGGWAFAFCEITEIIIPESVTWLDEHAFYACESLVEISIPGSVRMIGNGAFGACYNLITAKIEEGVTMIGGWAFEECFNLERVVIPDSVIAIDYGAFISCNKLQYNVKEGLQYLGNENNPYLYLKDYEAGAVVTSAMIENGCKIIAGENFNGNDAFEYNVKNGLKYLGNVNNPYLCLIGVESTSITEATIENDCKMIAPNAFVDCTALTEILIPGNVIFIGYSAFKNCSGLTTLTIEEGVLSIADMAFNNCSHLAKIKIPDSVISIGDDVFTGGYNLKSISIGNSVVSMGGGFLTSSTLRVAIIPKSVEFIEGHLFTFCNYLVFYCEAESKPAGWSTDWNSYNRPVYWYSENEPAAEGNYWHYGENGEIIIW